MNFFLLFCIVFSVLDPDPYVHYAFGPPGSVSGLEFFPHQLVINFYQPVMENSLLAHRNETKYFIIKLAI